MKKRLIITVAAVAAVGGGFYGYHLYSLHYPATDNAYITASVVHIAPQVSGRVAEVAVSNQHYVHAGDVLYKIDPSSFRLALDRARATLDQVRQDVSHDTATVVSAEAEVTRLEILLDNSTRRAQRARDLQTGNFVSAQASEDADAEQRANAAALAVARARLREARERLGAPGDQNQSVRVALAALGEAQWQLDNTTVNSSCDGTVTQLSLQPGDAVQQGLSNFVVVCDHNFWVEANFKETELERIRPGQPVTIDVDMYSNRTFRGKVESINAASGVAFSMLPPQNASGNWVKITQRVPVKIRVLDVEPEHPLRVGTSAHVRIDTTSDGH
ncbi:MAG: HlyD family secretion protein [Gammaproteobacteria bacterium]|nr:HlyD family secretion protein [Gammaproteobacteria bacterium]